MKYKTGDSVRIKYGIKDGLFAVITEIREGHEFPYGVSDKRGRRTDFYKENELESIVKIESAIHMELNRMWKQGNTPLQIIEYLNRNVSKSLVNKQFRDAAKMSIEHYEQSLYKMREALDALTK